MYKATILPLGVLQKVNDLKIEVAGAWMNNENDKVQHFVKLLRFAGHPYTLIMWRNITEENDDPWQANIVATHHEGPGVYIAFDLFTQFRCQRKGRTQRDAQKLSVRCALQWLRIAFGVDRFEDIFQEVDENV